MTKVYQNDVLTAWFYGPGLDETLQLAILRFDPFQSLGSEKADLKMVTTRMD